MLASAAAAFGVGAIALAHDVWVQPATFHPAVGESVNVHLYVGHAGEIEDIKRNPQRIEKFIIVGPVGSKDIAGEADRAPAGSIQPDAPGPYVIGFRSKHSFIELPATEFEQYLQYEGLDHVIAARKDRGESDKPGKEIYSRCAKSLLIVGNETPKQADYTLGFRLELIALKNPYKIKPGDDLPLQLLFEGKPRPNVLVKLKDPKSTTEEALTSARTDSDGKVTLKLDTAATGVRLINAVHMIEAPKDNPHGAQWESLWASLTFEVADKTD
jgi:uncharacterized GH25 family protein